MTTPLRVGLLGCGAFGVWHARVLAERSDIAFVAACDLDRPRAELVAARYGLDAYDDVDAFFAGAALDAVVIATPEGAHAANAKSAAGAGVAMFIEKPLARSVAELDEIAAAAEAAGVIVMAGHVERFEVGSAQLSQAVRAGICGRVVSICARRQFTPDGAGRFSGHSSTLRVLGIHDFDLVRWIHPAPVAEVFAVAGRGRVHDETGLDDHVMTTIRFADGAVGLVESAWTLPLAYSTATNPPDWSPAGNNRLDVFGDAGMVSNDMGIRSQQLIAFDHAEGFRAAGIRHQPVVYGRVTGALRDEIDTFLHVVRTGGTPPVGLDDARRAIALMDAAERSLAAGTPVRLDA